MTTRPASPSRFIALERAIELIDALREPVETIGQRDGDLARQIRRAASSVALNLGEGRRRFGKDRAHHFRIASCSADEVRVALRVAVAWGHVEEGATQRAAACLDELGAMLWRLTERR